MPVNIRFKQLKDPVILLATGFGSGLAPKAPGTAGTLVAAILVYFMQSLPLAVYLLITLAVTIMGIKISDHTARKLKVHDHPGIVIDEFAGYFITMIAAPVGWQWIIAGFVLFRLFDVIKPWPVSWLDKHVQGGLGIMLDDVVAGFMALACIQGFVLFTGM